MPHIKITGERTDGRTTWHLRRQDRAVRRASRGKEPTQAAAAGAAAGVGDLI